MAFQDRGLLAGDRIPAPDRAVLAAHGVTFDALADDGLVVAGQPIKLSLLAVNRGASDVAVTAVDVSGFDVAAACAGFVYALSVTDSMMRAGDFKRVLLVGTDALSTMVDWGDRSTCVLFGDGAGAVVMVTEPGEHGVLGTVLRSSGKLADLLAVRSAVLDRRRDPEHADRRGRAAAGVPIAGRTRMRQVGRREARLNSCQLASSSTPPSSKTTTSPAFI